MAGAGAQRKQEVVKRGLGVTEIGLSGERKFCRLHSAHMLMCIGCLMKMATNQNGKSKWRQNVRRK